MRAGELKDIISVWRNKGQRNDMGERTDNWVCVGQMRAAKSVQNSRKAFARGEVWYPTSASFRVRLGADVKTGDRIRLKEDLYDVVSVNEDRYNDMSITVNCELHNE